MTPEATKTLFSLWRGKRHDQLSHEFVDNGRIGQLRAKGLVEVVGAER